MKIRDLFAMPFFALTFLFLYITTIVGGEWTAGGILRFLGYFRADRLPTSSETQ